MFSRKVSFKLWHISFLLITLLLVSFAFPDKNDRAQSMFELGNNAYEKGNYDSAIVYYEKITVSGIKNSSVYYNLANACFRKSRLGYAVLYYEKARNLEPNDEDIIANIRFAKANLTDKISEPAVGFFTRALLKVYGVLSLRATTIMVSIMYLLVCLCIILGIFAGYNGRLFSIYIGTVFFLLLLVFGTSLAFKINQYEKIRYAVVLSSVVSVRNEPEGSQTLFSVHEGTKFRIRKRLDNWLLVSLPNGMAGWIAKEDVGEI